MWVKICANTTLADTLLAAEAGADAVGFVFAPSKRQVNAEQVREIVAGLPQGVARVGVFGYLPAAEIAAAAQHARLTAVQLHSLFNADYSVRLASLLGPEVAIIQTVHWALDEVEAGKKVAETLTSLQQSAPNRRALLDAKVAGSSGGLGVAFDWAAAGKLLSDQPAIDVILAGGLRPDNVAEAIRRVHPWGVDVASGVEREPGIKDPEKVHQFIKNARGA